MSIIQRVPWTVQPPHGVGVDKGNLLNTGLTALGYGNEKRNVISGLRPTADSAVTTGIGAAGRCIVGSASSVGDVYSELTALRTASMIFMLTVQTTGSTIYAPLGDSQLIGVTMRPSSGNAHRTIITDSGGQKIATGPSIVVGKLTFVAAQCDGTNVTIWVDGVLAGSTAAGLPTSGGGSLTVAGNNAATGYAGRIFLWGQYNRALTAGEHSKLAANPWQLFAPQTRRIWVPVSAGGAPTLSLATLTSITSTTARPRVTVTF